MSSNYFIICRILLKAVILKEQYNEQATTRTAHSITVMLNLLRSFSLQSITEMHDAASCVCMKQERASPRCERESAGYPDEQSDTALIWTTVNF